MLTNRPLERTIAASYLGPAEVTAVDLHDLTVRIGPEHEVDARLALAYPYQPVPGDLVLAIGHDDDYYVIGILRGSGKTELAFQGDVALRAVGGRLVGPFGGRDEQALLRLCRTGRASFGREVIGRCRFVDLVGAHGWAA